MINHSEKKIQGLLGPPIAFSYFKVVEQTLMVENTNSLVGISKETLIFQCIMYDEFVNSFLTCRGLWLVKDKPFCNQCLCGLTMEFEV